MDIFYTESFFNIVTTTIQIQSVSVEKQYKFLIPDYTIKKDKVTDINYLRKVFLQLYFIMHRR